MPTLDWIGKKAVLNHHKQVPYRLLQCYGKLSADHVRNPRRDDGHR
jgi:adenine-specific DNA-methyltransferase